MASDDFLDEELLFQELSLTDLTTLGRLVAQRRKMLGLSLDEASERLRVGRRLLSELEHGKRAVRTDTLIRVLNLFGFDLVVRPRFRRVT